MQIIPPANLPFPLLSINTTPAATTVVTTEEDLMSFILPANTLLRNGQGVKIRVWGTTATNANGKTIRLYFGSLVVAANITAQVLNGVDWVLEAIITRVGVGAQDGHGVFLPDAGATNESRVLVGAGNSPSEDETAAIEIKTTGQNAVAAANDIVVEGMSVELINAV